MTVTVFLWEAVGRLSIRRKETPRVSIEDCIGNGLHGKAVLTQPQPVFCCKLSTSVKKVLGN